MLHYRLRSTFDLEQPFGILLDSLLPLTHLYRVNAELLTNLIDCLHAPKCLKTNFYFELRAMDLPLLSFCHLAPPHMPAYSLNYGPEYGVRYTTLLAYIQRY